MRRFPAPTLAAAAAAALLLAGCADADFGTKSEPRVKLDDPGPNRVLAVVDISDQRVYVARGFEDGTPAEQHTWVASTGLERLPTPIGFFRPDFLSPDHVSSIYNVPMPWSVFFSGNMAIHGDPDTRLLGTRASHGCVRLDPADAEVFYHMVEDVGIPNTVIRVRE